MMVHMHVCNSDYYSIQWNPDFLANPHFFEPPLSHQSYHYNYYPTYNKILDWDLVLCMPI